MKHRSLRLTVIFLALVQFAITASGEEDNWRAGLSLQHIVPEEGPVMLAGYSSRTEPFTSALDLLRVGALALEDHRGTRVLILTADLIGFTTEVGDPIRDRIAAETKVARENILLNASHTHTGPALLLKRSEDSTMTEDQAVKSIAFTKKVQDTCVSLGVGAIMSLVPARLSFGSGVVNFPMNRREFTDKGVILGVNPRGPVDRGVSVLRIDRPDGVLMGVLFRASCHNTTFGSKDNKMSGDYAGNAQRFVEKEMGKGPALFMQGLAGDTNPYPNSLNDPAKRPAEEIAKAHGEELGREVVRVLQSGKLKPVYGPLTTAYGTANLPLQKRPSKEELEKLSTGAGSWKKWVAGRMLADAAANQPTRDHYPAAVSVWQFGKDLTMVGLSGEVVVDYVHLIEDAIGPLNLWLAAYCHDTFGYVPSARVLREGGYETRGLYSGGAGFIAPEAEGVLVDKVRELATKAGRTK